MTKKTILSGIRPTGNLHLGNYAGAVNQFLQLEKQENVNRYYFVADLHALTTITGPLDVRKGTIHMIRQYLACGLNPDLSAIYRQSDIPEIPYISTLLSMVAGYGRLLNCTTFKDKSEKQKAADARISAEAIKSLQLITHISMKWLCG